MKFKMPKIFGAAFLSMAIAAAIPSMASAHCDTMDGPVIADAEKALETNNIDYILKWVSEDDEQEMKDAFNLTKKVRILNPEAQELADQYFFQNLVRVHRAGEGAPYTGIKPKGTPIEEAVAAADKSIEVGNLDAFKGLIEEEKIPGLQERFERVLATKDFAVDDVFAGREYVEAYVQFTHYAEGEEHGDGTDAAHGTSHAEGGTANHDENVDAHATEKEQATTEAMEKSSIASLPVIPWSLAGVFFLTTLIIGSIHFRKHHK
ncbi:MAG TPA: LysM domain-containing protein [Bacillus bacterium]|nr:LysM domain-containing protein [Bacillus sp. (in: firmicutes)]